MLETTGWYSKINYEYGQFIRFGYQKGCVMLDPNNCTAPEYCPISESKSCDNDFTAGSHCTTDDYSKKCKYFQNYQNFVCSDPNYLSQSVNSKANTGESQGPFSRCYNSTIRGIGIAATKYSIRCYQTTCSKNGRSITIKIGNQKYKCNRPGQILNVTGFDGTLTCPNNF